MAIGGTRHDAGAGTYPMKQMGEMRRTFGISTNKPRSFKGVLAEVADKLLAPFRTTI